MNCTGGFKFGNMFFKFEYENDDTMAVAELFIEGKSEQAKKALECDHFNDAIYSFVRLNILKESPK